MKRLSLIGSWKRLGVQVGLLAGVGVAFIGGTEPPPVEAAPMCVTENMCSFKKPLFFYILDYSTSMNTMFDANNTRFEAAQTALATTMDADNGFLPANVILGLMRFGHDPNVNQMGTTINNDISNPKITDGQAIDVKFYDEAAPNKPYFECQQEQFKTTVMAIPPPINGMLVGIGTWTKGALDRAKTYFAQTKADHPMDMDKRAAAIAVLTDGEWTDPSGTMKLMPANQNPAQTAADLWNNQQIPTYVIAIGEAMGKVFADELAMAGGTNAAIDANNPQALVDALQLIVEDLKQQVIAPVCAPGQPRIMILLDASSSMLNINGGTQAGKMGETGWDQARDALAGANSLFDQMTMNGQKVENLVQLGLTVFGHNAPNPGEQKILVDYNPCMKDNFAWALDPNSSCKAPGCVDPYAGPPIMWTFQDGSMVDPPGFDAKTLSHMPKCDKSAQLPMACVGSGTYTHLGLQLIQQNIAAYKAACVMPNFPYPCDANTKYINILVTDGKYNSTPAQVQAPLEQMFMQGITTYVIGFGDGPDLAQLNQMAGWGSGGMEMAYDANNQMQLEAALQNIIDGITFNPCCEFNDCTLNPEPTTGEKDPICGDGVMDPGEECDDNNQDDGDGCSASCLIEGGNSSSTGGSSSSGGSSSTTDTTNTGSTTMMASATDTSTGPGTTTDVTTGTGTTGPGTTTEQPTTTAGMTTLPGTTGVDTTDTDTSGDSDSTTAGVGDGEGCGCKVDEQGSARGILASIFGLGLAGFIRRRRKAS